MYKIFIAMLLTLMPIHSYSQQKNSSLGVSGGMVFGSFRDDLYAPMIFDKEGFMTEFYYCPKIQPQKGFMQLKLNFSMGGIKYKDFVQFDSKFYKASISFDYLARLFRSSNFGSIYLGGRVEIGAQGIYLDKLATSYTYTINYSLMPSLRYFVEFGRSSFFSQLTIPIISCISRPPVNGYSADANETVVRAVANAMFIGNFATFGRYFSLDWHTNYSYRIAHRLHLGINYTMVLESYSKDFVYKDIEHNVSLSLRYEL